MPLVRSPLLRSPIVWRRPDDPHHIRRTWLQYGRLKLPLQKVHRCGKWLINYGDEEGDDGDVNEDDDCDDDGDEHN